MQNVKTKLHHINGFDMIYQNDKNAIQKVSTNINRNYVYNSSISHFAQFIKIFTQQINQINRLQKQTNQTKHNTIFLLPLRSRVREGE